MKDLFKKNVKTIKLPIKQIDFKGHKNEKRIGFKTPKTDETLPPRFQLIIVGKQDDDVEVVEVNKINFADLKKVLDGGKSIFMTKRQSRKYKPEIFIETHESDLWF